MLAALAVLLAACHNDRSDPAPNALGPTVEPGDLNPPVARMVEAMAAAAASARGQAPGQPGGTLIVQFTTVTNHTTLSERQFNRLNKRLFDALTDSGRTCGVIFASAQDRGPLAAHRLQIALSDLAEADDEQCLIQMSLVGPDHTGRVVRLWDDSTILPVR